MEDRETIWDQVDEDMVAFLNKHAPVATPWELLFACMGGAASALTEIRCEHCRKIAAQKAMEQFPEIIMDAMKAAAEVYKENPSVDHRH